MKNKTLIFIAFCMVMPLTFFGQFRKIYLDADSNNEVRNINFTSPGEGFVTFANFIGYTQDSGHSFSKKYVTLNNVDYNGFSVNLTFGFTLSGVYAFSRDSLLVYGDYASIPSILLTTDQGNTFKLLYYSSLQFNTSNAGIENMVFPQHTNTGYAVETNRILKTTDRGMSWSSILDDANNSYFDIKFFSDLVGYAVSSATLLKTTNGGASWQSITVPQGGITSMSFINPNTGWLLIGANVYYTNNGGSSWTAKNNAQFYPVNALITFVNDSTGYCAGETFTINKTTDSGKTWLPLQRDNNFSYHLNTFNKFFLLDSLTIWAGGAHGFIELTTNGGGTTLPLSIFTTDLRSLNTDSTIRFTNYSPTGYQYKWLKNSVRFASSYNASYVSSRQTIDTIQLVVIKGIYSDTSQVIIDTRAKVVKCFATFQSQVDTATVSLTSGYQTVGVKHYWNFGDGSIDTIHASPSHTYATIGNHTIIHKVYNTVDKCSDSTASVINIVRLQNCLSGSFTYTADSFYKNKLTLTLSFDSSKESDVHPVVTWNFGDGATGNGSPVSHSFDSSKYYTVCASVQNYNTGCVSAICQPVNVQFSDTCNANFLVATQVRNVICNGIPYNKRGKRNIWVVNNTDSINTGNNETFTYDFYTREEDEDFNMNGCSYNFYLICIDSLNRKITHAIYDSISKCTHAASDSVTIPREYSPFIKAVPDPKLPYLTTFYAYTKNGADSSPFYTTWRIKGADNNSLIYEGNVSQIRYAFSGPGNYTIAISANSCPVFGSQEAYYIHYYVAPVACPIYPPAFSYVLSDSSDAHSIHFIDSTIYQNSGLNNSYIWYFGDGDSSLQSSHTYAGYGVYNVTLKYTNVNGCSKEITLPITVAPLCSITAGFSLYRDPDDSSHIIFTNTTVSSDTAVTYTWYFGNGDSSVVKNPTYAYMVPGTYHIQLKSNVLNACVSEADTTIIITANDICNLKAKFTYTAVGNVVSFTNTSFPSSGGYKLNWDFGDGTSDTSFSPAHSYSTPGHYNVCLASNRDTLCSSTFCDSVIINATVTQGIKIIPNPVHSSFTLLYTSSEAAQIVIEIVNTSGIVMSSINQQVIVGANKFSFSGTNLQTGYYIVKITSSSGKTAQITFIKI